MIPHTFSSLRTVTMFCKVKYRGVKKAVIADDLKSLVNKGRHIFTDIM